MKTILISLKDNLKTTTYFVIPINKTISKLFPDKNIPFELRADNQTYTVHITSTGKKIPHGTKIIGGLKGWFEKNNFKKEDTIKIEIIKPFKIYQASKLNENTYEHYYEEQIDLIRLEGKKSFYTSTKYERDSTLRKKAIEIHGMACMVCKFDFSKKYGQWGEGFIEVHHAKQLAKNNGVEVKTDPYKDLFVLCSNCHSMIHRDRNSPLTVEELKQKLL